MHQGATRDDEDGEQSEEKNLHKRIEDTPHIETKHHTVRSKAMRWPVILSIPNIIASWNQKQNTVNIFWAPTLISTSLRMTFKRFSAQHCQIL